MSVTTHKLRVVEARKIKHPEFDKIEKHYFLVRAKDVPDGIRTDANARDPKGLKRRVYQDVFKSLMGEDAAPGTFDLMNKGIVCLADSVKRIDDETYEIKISDGQGIVDGGHTYRIICDAQNDANLPEEQCVEIQVRTGVSADLITDISRGLNTAIAVKQHSIDNLDGKYDWIKDLLKSAPYFGKIAWKEDDTGDYDVRDLICILEALNVIDFPNDESRHPISAYEKWSLPAKRFSDDFDKHEKDITKSTYYRLGTVLKDALVLYDRIRHDFRTVYDESELGTAAKLAIVDFDNAGKRYSFPFAALPNSDCRLTKGALYPIFGAFRNCVAIDESTGTAEWIGGFNSVLKLWTEVAPELAKQTKQATKDFGNKPDVLGKNRGHWTNMHQTVELHILRQKMKQSKGK